MSLASLTLVVSFCVFATADQYEISLNGDSWTLSDTSGRVTSIQATVPGQVHLDLWRAGIIGDPYFRFNDDALTWIAYSDWVYKTTFSLLQSDIQDHTLWLKCDGLDTVAQIIINGINIGQASNMHRRYFFDLTSLVNVGTNSLEVIFQSAANYSVSAANAYPYFVDPQYLYFPDAMRNFVRKTQSDFGWDWGPYFVPAGIWQNISVLIFDDAYVSYVVPKPYYHPWSQSYYVSLVVCWMVPVPLNDLISEVQLSIPGTPFEDPQKWFFDVSDSGETCNNFTSSPVPASMMDSFLWWPYTLTHKPPNLYNATVTITLSDQGGTVSTVTITKAVGFRNVELVQETPPDNGTGLTFYFRLNTSDQAYPLYIKGSNFIPMDAFLSRATPDVGLRLLTSVIEGNQNMIRVWGGGLYQVDWFYDLCDQLGIMVWQEMMFACAMYPRDTDFLENVRFEVIHQIRRLGHHPSIVLWSGNNENQDEGASTPQNLVDYSALYDGVIRTTLWAEDMTRPYWPASPSNGFLYDIKELGLYIQRWGPSSDPTYGDVHRYDYFDLCTDVTKFPRPRFTSEFGYQSYPFFSSLQEVSNSSDWQFNSSFMFHRQHHAGGNDQLITMIQWFFHIPDSADTVQQFKDFIYLTQLVQGICMKAEAEHYRRLLSESGAYTRGTLYWQLNDIWQAPSWSSIDYSGKWKVLHYFMRKVYEEILVSAYELNGNISVYVVVERPYFTISYSVQVQVVTWLEGKVVSTFTKDGLQSNGFTGVQVWTDSITDIFGASSITESFLYVSILTPNGGDLIADNVFFPSSLAEVNLPTPHISATNFVLTDANTVQFTLLSDAVAPYVFLDSGSILGNFNDNAFLLMPNQPFNIIFTSWEPVQLSAFEAALTIRTVRDTYN